MSRKLEIACFDVASAIRAARAGADRIELCADYDSGGLTPPTAWLEGLRASLAIPIHIMIRPRAGDYCYSPAEFEGMKTDILEYKALGADGFVFGILDKSNTVDMMRNKELVELARPLPCTFHRAFDCQADKAEALETIISLGFTTLLTSGVHGSALEGKEILRELVRLAAGRIQVMPGGGIRSVNITELASSVQASWYHSAAIQAHSNALDEAEVVRMRTAVS